STETEGLGRPESTQAAVCATAPRLRAAASARWFVPPVYELRSQVRPHVCVRVRRRNVGMAAATAQRRYGGDDGAAEASGVYRPRRPLNWGTIRSLGGACTGAGVSLALLCPCGYSAAERPNGENS